MQPCIRVSIRIVRNVNAIRRLSECAPVRSRHTGTHARIKLSESSFGWGDCRIQFAIALTAEHGGMIVSELGECARWPASEISDGAGDRPSFPPRALIGTDGEDAFDDRRRQTFSLAASARFVW